MNGKKLSKIATPRSQLSNPEHVSVDRRLGGRSLAGQRRAVRAVGERTYAGACATNGMVPLTGNGGVRVGLPLHFWFNTRRLPVTKTAGYRVSVSTSTKVGV